LRGVDVKLRQEDILNVVIGTAGHVDHGKTRLVEALTGTNADRWEEERERGITIDIGFASRELPDGRRVGFIDVPGHERFVRHMIAGAAGVDVVLLVVAADDGVIPQTREHLDVLDLLGAREGVVAVTKIDIDRELAEVAAEEVREFLKGTFLASATVVPCSAATGEGVEEVWRALVEAVARARPREAAGLFRMPVQRVFTREGFGTVLTGVPAAGTARAGDEVEVLPGGGRGRVRGVQAYFREVEVARAGHSTGLNVADLDPASCRRGQVVVPPGTFEPASLLDARLHLLPTARKPLRTGAVVRFHTGTAEVGARVVVLDRKAVAPGEDSLVQLRLDGPVVCARLDRFVVRRPSPALTTGGGAIIGPAERRLRSNRPWAAEEVRAREAASRTDEGFVEHLVEAAPEGSVRDDSLRRKALLPAERTREIVKSLLDSGRVLSFPPGPSYVHAGTLDRLSRRLGEALRDLHSRRPDVPGLDASGASAALGVPPALTEFVLQTGVERGEISRDGSHWRLASHEARLSGDGAALAGRIEARMREAGFAPPSLDELRGELGAGRDEVARVCAFLAREGPLVEAASGTYFHGDAVERVRRFLVGKLSAGDEVTTQEAKAFMGVSRKYMLPLLEHFDSAGLTRRRGDSRVPGPGFERLAGRERR
jgi:selenocysteine-specific elongation factor